MGSHGSSLDDILEEDMHHWYTKFMRESPSGVITLFELKTMLEINGMTEEASSYVDQVFLTFDMDGVKMNKTWLSTLFNVAIIITYEPDKRGNDLFDANIVSGAKTQEA